MWQGGLSWRPGPWAWGIVGFFLLATAVQIVPFSQGILEWASPVRAQVLELAGALLEMEWVNSAIAYSVSHALARWGFIICLGLFFWVCVSLGRDRKCYKGMVWVLIGLGVFEASYGLIQALIPQVGILWLPSEYSAYGTARGTLTNRNNFAGLMEMIWPVALGVTLAQGEWEDQKGIKAMLSEGHVGNQLIFFLMVVMMVLAVIFSQSRAGILGAFLGMAVFLGLLRTVSGRFRWGFRIIIGCIIALVFFYGQSMGFDKILDRFLALEAGSHGRMEIWVPTWQMVSDHPVGIGLGNYELVEPVYVDPGREGVRNYYPHNDYLQLLAEAGWAGAVVLVFGLFFFVVRAVRRIRKVGFDVGRFRLLVSVGALAGICSMAFHGFFDFNFQIPANEAYFVLLMALVEAGLWPRKGKI